MSDEKKYSPIIVPESINLDEDEINQDDKLGSLGIIPDEAPDVLKPAEEEEKKEGFLQGIKDKFIDGKAAAAEAIKRSFFEHYIQKVTHCLPRANHPTKKRLTRTQIKAKRKGQKMARRKNRNRNRTKPGRRK